MANNPYVNKVQYGNEVLIDISNDTVAADKILSGYTAHNKAGAAITGTIVSKDIDDITFTEIANTEAHRVFLRAEVPAGYYDTNGYKGTSIIHLPVPSSGTVGFTVYIPNGTANPSLSTAADWLPVEIEVDSNGNSNIYDNTVGAIDGDNLGYGSN